MSIKVGTGSVSIKGFDAVKFKSESCEGFGKLKAMKAFLRGVSIDKETAQTFVQNHSSKLSKTLDERLVAYDKELKNSRITPDLDKIMEKAEGDMAVYDYIRDKYSAVGLDGDLAELRDLSSKEVLSALRKTGIFPEQALNKIKGLGTDLEGSPYW